MQLKDIFRIIQPSAPSAAMRSVAIDNGKLTGGTAGLTASIHDSRFDGVAGLIDADKLKMIDLDGVEVTDAENKITLKRGRSRWSLAKRGAIQDYPYPESDPEAKQIEINAALFRLAINSVHVCAAKQDPRQYLNGIHLMIDSDGSLMAESSDGHRVARHGAKPAQPIADIIIPVEAAKLITMISSESIVLAASIRSLSASSPDGSESVAALTIDGKYPAIDRILEPADDSCRVTTDGPDLLLGLKDAMVTANKLYSGVTVESDGESLTISSANPDYDHSEINVGCQISGPIKSSYSCKYLIDALSASDGAVDIQLHPDKPALIEYDGVIHAVMPMHL